MPVVSVSIHAPREGCDRSRIERLSACNGFNSRTPGGVRLQNWEFKNLSPLFQFTHPGRGATYNTPSEQRRRYVSIHAPREGCDSFPLRLSINTSRFNSRTPGGVRPRFNPFRLLAYQFQFTHPGRGATQSGLLTDNRDVRFNSRTPGGVRLQEGGHCHSLKLCFNSRTPGGVRLISLPMFCPSCVFQFTHPGRGATMVISKPYPNMSSFNSRTPGGVRLATRAPLMTSSSFNSRTPGGVRLRTHL